MKTNRSTRLLCFGQREKRSAFSLIEIVIAVFLVGIMLVASLKSVGAVMRTISLKGEQKQRTLLAQDLMDEILQAFYEDPQAPSGSLGADMGEASGDPTRTPFDDVDDYDGWSTSPPQTKVGAVLSNHDGWSRKVLIDYVNPLTHAVEAGDTGLKLIIVKVFSPDGQEFQLSAFRSRWGTLEKEPALTTTYITGAETELQVGPDTMDRLRSENTFVNQVDAN